MAKVTVVKSELDVYARDFDKRVDKFLTKIAELGANRARYELKHTDTGETLGSINGQKQGDSAIIEAGGNAIWIEFGTGVFLNRGEKYPGDLPPGIVGHGQYGKKKGNYYSWYYEGEDGKIHKTYGIRMNPFMYNTYKWLIDNINTLWEKSK